MGVINKLKGRMSGYNALTKGPAKFDDFGFNAEYKPSTSGVDAVTQGLRAGSMAALPEQEGMGQEMAEAGANLGTAIAESGVLKDVGKKRKEFIDKKKEEGKTGKEARKDWRAHKKQGRELKRSLRKLKKQGIKSGDIVNAFTNYPVV